MKADFSFFFLFIFLAAAIAGWQWPDIAKIMPVYVAAVPGLVLVFVQLYRDATGWEQQRRVLGGIEMDEVADVKLDGKTEARRTLSFFAWLVGGAVGIWLLGIVITLPLLIFFYTLVEGKEKWSSALVMTACTYALVWGLFEYMLDTRWPPRTSFRLIHSPAAMKVHLKPAGGNHALRQNLVRSLLSIGRFVLCRRPSFRPGALLSE